MKGYKIFNKVNGWLNVINLWKKDIFMLVVILLNYLLVLYIGFIGSYFFLCCVVIGEGNGCVKFYIWLVKFLEELDYDRLGGISLILLKINSSVYLYFWVEN